MNQAELTLPGAEQQTRIATMLAAAAAVAPETDVYGFYDALCQQIYRVTNRSGIDPDQLPADIRPVFEEHYGRMMRRMRCNQVTSLATTDELESELHEIRQLAGKWYGQPDAIPFYEEEIADRRACVIGAASGVLTHAQGEV